jgi:hypothetical protein
VDEPTDSDIQDVDVEHNERDRETDDEESLSGRSDVEPDEEQVPDSDQTQERTSTEQDTGGSATASEEEVDSKKKVESSEELERLSEEEFDALDDNLDWKRAKHQWKQENPSETLKEYKDLYLNGVINELPWEEHLPEGVDLKKKKRYIMKEKGQQVRKETDE